MNTNNPDQIQDAAEQLALSPRTFSTEQLARLGVAQVAYVKPVMMEGRAAFAIHAADGTPMAVADSRDVAVAAIEQHDMLVALVH